MDSNQACVSKRSLVDVGNAAIYASPDGLAKGSVSGVQLIGDDLFSRNQWQALKPESIHAYYHDEKYLFFYDNGTKQGGYILDPSAKTGALTELGFYIDSGFNDLATDTLYLLKDGEILSFQHGDPISYTWRSAQFQLPNLMPYSVCRVVADDYPAEISIIYDGEEMVMTYVDDQPFRFHAGRRARYVEVELRGTNSVKLVMLGNDMESVNG
jgi:hypothetical protein